MPGNFFMLSVDDSLDPLLKRPFSIHRSLKNDFQIMYRVAGKGTDILSRRKPGDLLEAIGPLGNKFPRPKAKDKVILIAGGIGIAPIFNLAEALLKTKPVLFYGARTQDELLCLDELKALGIDTIISTDDGTFGRKGFITDSLKNYLTRHSSPITDYSLYACGPEPMLRALSVFVKKHDLRCSAAFEQNMACGLGTCLGCVVHTVAGYKRVCKEGPVFPMDEIVWD